MPGRSKNKNSLVTIIIPVYNCQQWLEDAVVSCINQTHPNIEILIVDDESTDNSGSIAERLASTLDQVRYFCVAHGGAAKARNHGINKARGDWIQFLDADDILHPRKIERQLEKAGDSSTGVIISCYWKRFVGSTAGQSYPEETYNMPSNPLEWLQEKYLHGIMMPIHGWLSSRDAIEAARGFNERMTCNDDGEFFDRVALECKKILHVPSVLAFYRSQIPGSLSTLKSEQALMLEINARIATCERLMLMDPRSRTKEACAAVLKRAALEAYPRYRKASKQAEAASKNYAQIRLHVGGGMISRFVDKLFGWRAARVVQEIGRSAKNRLAMLRAQSCGLMFKQ